MFFCLQTITLFWVLAMCIPLAISLVVPFVWSKPKPQDNDIIWSVLTMNAYVAVALANVLGESTNLSSNPTNPGPDLWAILTLAVALGAYTSTILIGIHGKLRSAKDEITKCQHMLDKTTALCSARQKILNARLKRAQSNRDRHSADRDWLIGADILVAVISLVVICTIILKDVNGSVCYPYQLTIDGLFLALIVYFITLHLRQWVVRHKA